MDEKRDWKLQLDDAKIQTHHFFFLLLGSFWKNNICKKKKLKHVLSNYTSVQEYNLGFILKLEVLIKREELSLFKIIVNLIFSFN